MKGFVLFASCLFVACMSRVPRRRSERGGAAGNAYPSTSLILIRRLRNKAETMIYNMSFAMADVFKIAPMIAAMAKNAVSAAALNAAYRDALNYLLKRGSTITLFPVSENHIKPFPREITLSGNLETAYDRCVEAGEDEMERVLRQIYCGYALLNLMSLVGFSRTPTAMEM